MTPLRKFPKNVRDLGKLTVAKGLKTLPKVQKIAQSGHTATVMVIHLASFVELSHGQRSFIKNVKIFGHSWAAIHNAQKTFVKFWQKR